VGVDQAKRPQRTRRSVKGVLTGRAPRRARRANEGGSGAVKGGVAIKLGGVLPHVFDWVIPGQLAACVNPAVSQQAASELREAGAALLINLYEMADPPELLADLGLEGLHLPVQNSDPPTQEQLRTGVAAIQATLAAGERVVVHCAAGLGRSGTLLAAYLVSQGLDPEAAIARVREARPGSVETLGQERAVHEFARRLAADQAPASG